MTALAGSADFAAASVAEFAARDDDLRAVGAQELRGGQADAHGAASDKEGLVFMMG